METKKNETKTKTINKGKKGQKEQDTKKKKSTEAQLIVSKSFKKVYQ